MRVRYAITKLRSNGSRTLALENTAQNHWDTREAAQAKLDSILASGSIGTLWSIYGDYTKMRVQPVPCYDDGRVSRTCFHDRATVTVPAPEGWEILSEGDNIREGDGLWHPDFENWIVFENRPDLFRGDMQFAHTWPWRRKLEAQPERDADPVGTLLRKIARLKTYGDGPDDCQPDGEDAMRVLNFHIKATRDLLKELGIE